MMKLAHEAKISQTVRRRVRRIESVTSSKKLICRYMCRQRCCQNSRQSQREILPKVSESPAGIDPASLLSLFQLEAAFLSSKKGAMRICSKNRSKAMTTLRPRSKARSIESGASKRRGGSPGRWRSGPCPKGPGCSHPVLEKHCFINVRKSENFSAKPV